MQSCSNEHSRVSKLEQCADVLHTFVVVLYMQGLLDAVAVKKFCSDSAVVQTAPPLQLPLSGCAEVSPTAANRLTASHLVVRELCSKLTAWQCSRGGLNRSSNSPFDVTVFPDLTVRLLGRTAPLH